MTPKKVPMRMCLGCGEMKPKRELIRVVKQKQSAEPSGEQTAEQSEKQQEAVISLDTTGKKAGRGAYICPRVECLDRAQKARKLEKAFACRISTEVYEALRNEMQEAEGN